MAHSFVHLLAHIVFSTKDRRGYLDDGLRPRVQAYAGGVIRELGAQPLSIGGTTDHLHALVALPATLAMADLLRVVKTNTSRWVHEQFPEQMRFGWQTGYGAFSVSESACEAVRAYIAGQEEHHRKMTFQEEFLALLQRHGIEYDPRFVWE